MMTVNNKANIQPVPTLFYSITTSDLVKYLQDQLGFTFIYDFTRWTGVDPDHSYVRMRVAFNPSDIICENKSNDYADRQLAKHSAGIKFKDTVIDTLKPFMIPTNFGPLKSNQDTLNKLANKGLTGERLNELERYSQLTYTPNANMFRIYLRPEKIIGEMLQDPTTNLVSGEWTIIGVRGTTSDTLRWDVAVTENKSVINTPYSLDSIFNQI